MKSQNTVRNTKATFKTGKNEKAENLLKRSFQPRFSSKDGTARLTFCGLEHSYNNMKKVINGKEEIVQEPKLVIVFSCLDETHEAPQNIGVRVDYKLSKNNAFGRFAMLLGYEFKDITEIVDGEDEFGAKTVYANPQEIFDFLRGKCGLVFKANLKKAMGTKKNGEKYEKGLWNIDLKTLAPMMKNGEQLRDMLASDITDEEYENPTVAMESEDNE